MTLTFAPGTVGYLLTMLRGTWHDHITISDLAGNPLTIDEHAGSPGAAPFDNLVYIDFDGEHYTQTNVTFRGRPLHVRTFTGRMNAGILHFDSLGPHDPGHIGVAAGINVLAFLPGAITDALQRYTEPDFITLHSPHHRTRSTVLYRGGTPLRSLFAQGTRIAPTAAQRSPDDPRGQQGSVHENRSTTQVFTRSQAQE
jgi:hypothetical protein